jgi:hypothetical protein
MPKKTRKPSAKAKSMADAKATGIVTESISGEDSFSNPSARLGFGTPSLGQGAHYPLTRHLTWNYLQLLSMYRSQWPIRRVIDLPVVDALKNGIKITNQQRPEAKDAFARVLKQTQTMPKIGEAARWGRLFGGGAAIPVIKGHEDWLDTPLDLDDIAPGSYQGLMVFDRWSGINPSSLLVDEWNTPLDHNLPSFYQCTTAEGAMFEVHASRVLRFCGRGGPAGSLPQWHRQEEQHWSVSEIELVFDALRQFDNTSWAIAELVFRANILALKQKGQADLLSLGTPAQQKRLAATMSNINWLMSNQSVITIGDEDDLQALQFAFAGLGDVWDRFAIGVAGAAEMPVSKLWGRTISNLGNTGDGDRELWQAKVEGTQSIEIEPSLDRLFPIVAMSTWGMVPDDFAWAWNPVRKLDGKDQAELAERKGGAINTFFTSGIFTRKQALREIQATSEETGIGLSITDEEVAAADDTPIAGDLPLDPQEDMNAQTESESIQTALTA